jgi:hypothetical protein
VPAFSTSVLETEHDVALRLSDWQLAPEQLKAVARAARNWANDASPLMPQNAPGTLAYIFGVQELRRQLVNTEWRIDRTSGIEAVINPTLRLRIGFQNVDRACDLVLPPHPRSAKGSASESLCGPSLFEFYGIEPGPLSLIKDDGVTTYYVMVGEDGSVELSSPVIRDGLYRHFNERIFIHKPASDWEENISTSSEAEEHFDIEVTFKDA